MLRHPIENEIGIEFCFVREQHSHTNRKGLCHSCRKVQSFDLEEKVDADCELWADDEMFEETERLQS